MDCFHIVIGSGLIKRACAGRDSRIQNRTTESAPPTKVGQLRGTQNTLSPLSVMLSCLFAKLFRGYFLTTDYFWAEKFWWARHWIHSYFCLSVVIMLVVKKKGKMCDFLQWVGSPKSDGFPWVIWGVRRNQRDLLSHSLQKKIAFEVVLRTSRMASISLCRPIVLIVGHKCANWDQWYSMRASPMHVSWNICLCFPPVEQSQLNFILKSLWKVGRFESCEWKADEVAPSSLETHSKSLWQVSVQPLQSLNEAQLVKLLRSCYLDTFEKPTWSQSCSV